MGAYAALSQGRVWYEQRGDGEPLVLIHGGAVDSRFFEHNVGPLAERFRVIAIDLWGHGRTPHAFRRFAASIGRLSAEPPQYATHRSGRVAERQTRRP
jgi:pimeloyl-ACP methyl ester carboxylesterase